MKKLTAGIFSGLLTICMAGAANADIASTGYVDAKADALGTLIDAKADASTVSGLGTRIDANANDIEALQTAYGSDELTTTSKNLVGAINELKDDMANVASDATVGELGDRVNALDADVSGLSAAINNEQTGLSAVNKIASDASAAAAGATGAIDTINATMETYGDIVTHNTNEFATAAQGALATTINETIETYGDIVTHNTDEFATAAQGALAATAVQPDAIAEFVTATDIDDAIAGKQNALTETQIAAVDSGITAARVEQYNAYADQIAQMANSETVNTELAKKANTTDLGALATAKLPDSCSRAGATCVLTFNGTTYAWEDISRATTGE